MDMDERERRLGLNEVLFREVNERLADVRDVSVAQGSTYDFICECANRDCDARVAVTIAEYERVRSEPTNFLIHPGHEFPEIESVVLRSERYAVVLKRGGEAAELAAEHDPRS
jgi:hypothetical protein